MTGNGRQNDPIIGAGKRMATSAVIMLTITFITMSNYFSW